MTEPWTVGVEQEFLLVDPETRRPVPPADSVAQHAGAGHDVQRELTPFQIEVATPVCETTEEPAEQVVGTREAVVIVEVIRAFARTAAESGEPGRVDDVMLRAACWRAARDGVDGLAVDPRTGNLVPARDRPAELVSWCADALGDASALSIVEDHVAWSGAHGSGAARRRRAFGGSPDARGPVDLILAETVDDAR
ncbi:glutamate-cysteine ligase family protein [Saccharothrix sp. 6-C]|uniref:glutamate-cysteine ligase family protein n=1 Tax=Saccharothrix sp. 6-C TaxID=2781735 RepID=UPI001F32DB9D|nr:glutamate-cysteine ligase family protein [Saccharothrix sp. 6-C]